MKFDVTETTKFGTAIFGPFDSIATAASFIKDANVEKLEGFSVTEDFVLYTIEISEDDA